MDFKKKDTTNPHSPSLGLADEYIRLAEQTITVARLPELEKELDPLYLDGTIDLETGEYLYSLKSTDRAKYIESARGIIRKALKQ